MESNQYCAKEHCKRNCRFCECWGWGIWALYNKMNNDISLDVHADIDTMKKLMEWDDLIDDMK